MLRAGVSLPALMKLLGHRTANMTLRYVEVTQKDLQREFHLARQQSRHLVPLPASATLADPDTADATAVVERLVRRHPRAGPLSPAAIAQLTTSLSNSFSAASSASAPDFKNSLRVQKTKNRLSLAGYVTLNRPIPREGRLCFFFELDL